MHAFMCAKGEVGYSREDKGNSKQVSKPSRQKCSNSTPKWPLKYLIEVANIVNPHMTPATHIRDPLHKEF